jgi:hypothetical protein
MFKSVSGWSFVVFISYTLLCLVADKAHPFSTYTMFNQFPKQTTVFLLKDQNQQPLPFDKYFNIDADQLFQYHEAVKQTPTNDSLTYEHEKGAHSNKGEQLYTYLMRHQTAKLPTDSLGIYAVTYRIHHQQFISHEKQLYSGDAQ